MSTLAENVVEYALEFNKSLTLLDFTLLHEWCDLFEDVLKGFNAREVLDIWFTSRNVGRIQ